MVEKDIVEVINDGDEVSQIFKHRKSLTY